MLIIQCTHHAHYCPGCHSPKIGKVFSFEMLIDMVDIMDFIRHRPRAKGSASSSYHLWCLQMSLPNKSNTCIIFCYCWQVFSMQITCILMEKKHACSWKIYGIINYVGDHGHVQSETQAHLIAKCKCHLFCIPV